MEGLLAWARRPSTLTLAWVAVQMLLPLHYYAVRREADVLDEAYAWRMFSDTGHSESLVEWFEFCDGDKEGRELNRTDLRDRAGFSEMLARLATGRGRASLMSTAPAVWIMDRIASHLCRVLDPRPTGIAARREIVPWEGDARSDEFVWDCQHTK